MKDAELSTLQQLLNDRGWRLRFREDLENEFQQDYARRYYLHMQVAEIMGVIAFMACGILDLIWMPEKSGRTWLIRMVAGVPMWGPLLLSFWGKFRQKIGERYMQLFICIFTTSAVGGLIAIALNSTEPYNYYYYNSVTVIFVIIFVLSRIQFKWGMISAIIMWFSLNVGLIAFGPAINKLAIVII
ncbi:MAG TPA: hypothetical protein DDX93_05705, partial [Smithella sp.]|nr:hypothetical protein [Smithella sp.]